MSTVIAPTVAGGLADEVSLDPANPWLGAPDALMTMSSARNERVGHQHHDSHFRVHCGHSVDIANENWTSGMRTDKEPSYLAIFVNRDKCS